MKTMGDAVMASFASESDAVAAAIAMLERCHVHHGELGLSVKLGVCAGACLAVRANERLDQSARQNQVRDPQRGEQRLVERANVDHAVRRIEALERGQRTIHVAELAVVVVFENPGRSCGRPVEEPPPPLDGHGDAGRILMRRRDVHEPGARRGGDPAIDVQPGIVDRDRDDMRSREHERDAAA